MAKDHLLNSGFALLVLLISMPLHVAAELHMGLSLDRLSASAWSMENVRIDLKLINADRLSIRLTADSLDHQALPGTLNGIRLDCPVERHQQYYRCDEGQLNIADTPYGPQALNASGTFFDSEHLSIDIQGIKVANGKLNVELELIEGRWDLALYADRIRLESLPKRLTAAWLPEGSDFSGAVKLSAKASGFMSQAEALDISLQVTNFTYADVEGLRVAEEGEFRLQLNADQKDSGWSGKTRLSLSKGQFYADPIFVEVLDEPLLLELRGHWRPGANRVRIVESRLVLPTVMESQGQAEIDTSSGELVEAELRIHSNDLGALYGVILQPMLIGSMVDEVEASGVVDTEVSIKKGELQRLHVSLEDVNIDDRRGLFALYGLSGGLAWNQEDHSKRSEITIEGGQLYRIDFGKLGIRVHAQRGEVRLEEPIALPLMQGTMYIDHLSAEGLLGDLPQWTTSAQFSDISLRALAEAFDWPPMEGTLQGMIPRVHYQQQRLELDGELVVDVFGGTISVGELVIEDPLGRVPELFADLQLSGLDLTQITQTFSFGHITGGLEGEIAGLHLASWEPIAFKARFNTPEQDRIPHRISQRAVDNLTALGNGVGSGLSTTFLGIFKEFRYNRIELQAELNGNVAELDGMPRADGGYYIVKGSGLPRIDVIARNRQVAWKTLLERLKSIRVEGMEMR
ncbi:MAG: hypothetical protein KME56_18185 [Candidatus Thiodiazotropha sp. (ex Ctena orbiculata)]|nr:hypothetical protein [Candidatus Thiodiazotropha taylori]MBT2998541.1 hypothetical protein [Candidatus Thiodiazotropha taylori]MBT3002715.1 hypothetical protein [Candidatus Thiodiazotropha taylori]MBT3028857.1 hypothetical protein [Candidatus Thiodiazotropha taylori]MBT3036573.1 hypothetical protein [Candidatus Thiodiazotropha taylori]